MNLDDAQQKAVTQWIEQGLKLSEIQSRLATEFGLRLTYMDVRFLIDDLKLKLKDPEPPKGPVDLNAGSAVAPASSTPAAPFTPEQDEPLPGGGGKVSVTVDQIARAGAMVSGKVTFSDGKSAEWYLDQQGRLGLAAADKSYRPSQQDVMDFQTELQSELAKLGY
jgi:hypothetical protein